MEDDISKGFLGSAPSDEDDRLKQFVDDLNRHYIEEQLVKRRAALNRSNENAALAGGLSALSRLTKRHEIEFEEQLFKFALKRNLPLGGNWKSYAMRIAAEEHPELEGGRRKPGRPSKESGKGFLDTPFANAIAEENDGKTVKEVERAMASLQDRKRPSSQKAAIQQILRDERPDLVVGSSVFDSEFTRYEKAVGAARKRIGKPLKPGRKRKINAAK